MSDNGLVARLAIPLVHAVRWVSERGAATVHVVRSRRRPKRARVFVVSADGYVALIARHRNGVRYWAVPGGGIEPGESAADAARREVREELGLDVTLGARLDQRGAQVFYVARLMAQDDLLLGGPERLRNNPLNSYEPVWVPLEKASTLWLRPPGAAEALAQL